MIELKNDADVRSIKFYKPEEVKAMDVTTLVDKLEEKIGQKLDGGTLAWLALAKGANTVHVVDLAKGENRDETIDWEKITEILNSPPRPPPPPYEGPKVIIEDPRHFTDALLFAIEHTPIEYDEDPNTGKLNRRRGPVDSLIENLVHLHTIANNYAKNGWHFRLSPDFVKHSFVFVCQDSKNRHVYNGGLILHRSWNSTKRRYEDDDRMEWNIHT